MLCGERCSVLHTEVTSVFELLLVSLTVLVASISCMTQNVL